MTEVLKVLSWDGFPISSTHYIPENQNGKVLLVINGVGENQKKYSAFASFFAEQGFSVYTFDFRGIGESRQGKLRKQKADLRDWAMLDLDAIISYILGAHKQPKLVIAAHGIGGVLTGLSRMSKKADAILLVGSQAPYHQNLNGFLTRAKYSITANFLIPFFTSTIGYFPASAFGLCDDLPKNAATQLIDWSRSRKAVLADKTSNESGFDAMEQRTLAISFSDDPIATSRAVTELLSFFPRIRAEHWHFTPEQVVHKSVGHYGFFRRSMKSVLWMETLAWINASLSASRSKAA